MQPSALLDSMRRSGQPFVAVFAATPSFAEAELIDRFSRMTNIPAHLISVDRVPFPKARLSFIFRFTCPMRAIRQLDLDGLVDTNNGLINAKGQFERFVDIDELYELS